MRNIDQLIRGGKMAATMRRELRAKIIEANLSEIDVDFEGQQIRIRPSCCEKAGVYYVTTIDNPTDLDVNAERRLLSWLLADVVN